MRMTSRADRWSKRKVAGVLIAVVLVVPALISMYATELTRLLVYQTAPSPIPLPDGVDVRYSDAIVAVLGTRTPTGRANAITLGYAIVVPNRFDALPLSEQKRVILHELTHVEQRRKYWRFYLPVYGLLYVVRGYTDHPFEARVRSFRSG